MIKHIPNLITSLNLLCGSVAVLFAAEGNLVTAAIFVFLGIVFDFFDGLAARLLKAHSELGLQLDSLADLITSGLVPAIVMVQLLNKAFFGTYFQISDLHSPASWNIGYEGFLPLIGLFILLASAYRLAKFNIDGAQTNHFIGLPTPANALLIISLALIAEYATASWALNLIANPWFLLGMTLLSGILLNMNLPLFALKFKSWGWRENAIRYVFLALCLLLLFLLKFLAIPLIIVVYVLMSMFWRVD